VTNTAGQVLYDQWELLGKSEPVEMDLGTITFESPCPADLAEPLGTLNFFDVAAFLSAYNTQDAAADFAAPFGTFNFFDVAAFLAAYNAGCP
jgi:hypothetical protein